MSQNNGDISELREFLRPVNKHFKVIRKVADSVVTQHNAKWINAGKDPHETPPKNLWNNMRFTIDFIEKHILTKVENKIGKRARIRVTSGWRSREYNILIGAKTTSQHGKFTALDIVTENFDQMIFREVCDEVFWGVGQAVNMGLGFYNSFTHIDVSNNQSRTAPYTWFWDGNKTIRRSKGQLTLPASSRSSLIPSGLGGEGGDGNTEPPEDFLFDEGQREKIELDVQDLGKFLTPEEYRKGIVAQVYYINDWHLSQVGNSENEDNKKNQAWGNDILPDAALAAFQDSQETSSGNNNSSGNSDRDRGDMATNPRQRYVMSLVDAEFYRRRFQSRQVPAVSGPFNPYPVPGFPALVMTPGRPIIGMATNVTHQINVASGSGTTSVSIASPRYWDEGDVWYWMGGWSMKDWEMEGINKSEDQHLYQRFPLWHNRHTMATNNYSLESSEVTRTSNLDYFYRFMLGCDGIPYRSNNYDKVSDSRAVRDSIRDRNPGNFEVHPETLAIKDYNEYIAKTGDDGKFMPGTLAFDIFGHNEPYHVHESTTSVEKQIKYSERYGISERDLFVEFLNNKYNLYKGRLVLTGRTFGEKGNNLQKQVVEYMEDIERRQLTGRTP